MHLGQQIPALENADSYVTVQQAAKTIGVSVRTVYRLIERGIVRHRRHGRWALCEKATVQGVPRRNPRADHGRRLSAGIKLRLAMKKQRQ